MAPFSWRVIGQLSNLSHVRVCFPTRKPKRTEGIQGNTLLKSTNLTVLIKDTNSNIRKSITWKA